MSTETLLANKIRHSNASTALVDSYQVKGGFMGSFADYDALVAQFESTETAGTLAGAGDPNTLVDMSLAYGSTAHVADIGDGTDAYYILVDPASAYLPPSNVNSGWELFRSFIDAGTSTGLTSVVEGVQGSVTSNTYGLRVGINGTEVNLAVDYGGSSTTSNVVLDAPSTHSSTITSITDLQQFVFFASKGSGNLDPATGVGDNNEIVKIHGENLFDWLGSGITFDDSGTDVEVTEYIFGNGLTATNVTGVITVNATVAGILAGDGFTAAYNSGTGVYTLTPDVSDVIAGTGIKVTDSSGDHTVALNYSATSANYIAAHSQAATATEIGELAGPQGRSNYEVLINKTGTNRIYRTAVDDLGFLEFTATNSTGVLVDATNRNAVTVNLAVTGTQTFISNLTAANATTLGNISNAEIAIHTGDETAVRKVSIADTGLMTGIPATDTADGQSYRLALMPAGFTTGNEADELKFEQGYSLLYESVTNGSAAGGTLVAPNVRVEGNLEVVGDMIQYNSTEVTIEDQIMTLGALRDDVSGELAGGTNTGDLGFSFVESQNTNVGSSVVTSTDAASMLYNIVSEKFKFTSHADNAVADNVKALVFDVTDTGADFDDAGNANATRSLGAVSKTTLTITGDGTGETAQDIANQEYNIRHNLGTQDVAVIVIQTHQPNGAGTATSEITNPYQVISKFTAASDDEVTVKVSNNPREFEQYTVIVIG